MAVGNLLQNNHFAIQQLINVILIIHLQTSIWMKLKNKMYMYLYFIYLSPPPLLHTNSVTHLLLSGSFVRIVFSRGKPICPISDKKLLKLQTHLRGRGSASIFSSVQLSPCFANPLRLETDQTQDFINVNIKKIKSVNTLTTKWAWRSKTYLYMLKNYLVNHRGPRHKLFANKPNYVILR